MKAIRLVLTMFLVPLMVLGATPVSADGIPPLPHAFYGSVTINGEPAPVGTVISAAGSGVETGTLQNPTITAEEGSYGTGGGLKLLVQAEAGSTINFYVNGVSTGQTAPFQSGETSRVDLSVTIEYTLTISSSSGGSVTSPGEGSFVYEEGAVVSIIATTSSGYQFGNWSGDTATIADVNDPTTTITMKGNYSIRANFSYIPTEPPTTTPTVDELETDLFGGEGGYDISSEGEILETIEATSEDGNFTITIPEGTFALDEDGNPLTNLEVEIDESPPNPPEDAHIIGLPYTFSPAGATFNPPIVFEFSYDDADIPEGVDEEDLVIAYYDKDAGEWVELECVELECEVDTINNIVTAQVSHFTTFALIAPAAASTPADFSISGLEVEPAEVQVGEAVTVTATVSNTGGSEGGYVVILKINGAKEAEQSVTLAAGASQEVTFNVTREEPGSYNITINGLSGSFTVTATTTPTETATTTATITVTQPPETVTETTALPPETVTTTERTTVTHTKTTGSGDSTNWLLIGGLIAGAVVVAGLLVYFLDRRSAY